MRVLLIAASVAATIGVPIAVSGQDIAQIRSSHQRDQSARRVCRVEQKSGTRLGRVSRCSTQQEDAQNKEDSRRTIERVQAMRFPF